MMNNARSQVLTATAGNLSLSELSITTIILISLSNEVYDIPAFYPSGDVTGSEFLPLSNIPHCCLNMSLGLSQS